MIHRGGIVDEIDFTGGSQKTEDLSIVVRN